MNQREARDFIGSNVHFNPKMNPPGSPRTQSRFMHKKPAQPIQISRQISATSDGTASPTASPVAGRKQFAFNPADLQKAADAARHKPIFKSFDFTD